MIFFEYIEYIMPAAFFLDLILGDPNNLPHPVRWMGKAISFFEPKFRKLPISLKTSGFLFVVFMLILTLLAANLILYITGLIHTHIQVLMEIIIIYYCLAIRSLYKSAIDVHNKLKLGDIKKARQSLSYIVGRDVKNLDEERIIKATIETVAENLTDGVISPLFYAFIGGAPLCLAFKMVSTLDSMIGYKNKKYIDFGRTGAKLDDVANFIPARISVFIIAIVAKIFLNKDNIIKKTFKEAKKHVSPNSGYSEAAFAFALNIRLGGPIYYEGVLADKAYIGEQKESIKQKHIAKACHLMFFSSLLFFIMSFLIFKLLRPFSIALFCVYF